jgi:uncharacterized protein
MTPLLRLLWICGLPLLCAGHAAAQLKTVHTNKPRYTDKSRMLTPDERRRLEAVLTDYETKTGSQIAVLLVASTEPEAIEQYGIRVTDAWKLGRKGVDDGVLLLVAKDNPKALRRLRIEAGRGVQGVLTDAQSKRILEDTIAPHFRQQDWYGGLVAGVGAIATLLNQEKFPAPAQSTQQAGAPATDYGLVLFGGGMGIMFLVIVAAVVAAFRAPRAPVPLARQGRRARETGDWTSGATGFILGSMLNSALNDDDRRRDSGFSGGFSDSGGGGFSGGGGSFDGGGASGDW